MKFPTTPLLEQMPPFIFVLAYLLSPFGLASIFSSGSLPLTSDPLTTAPCSHARSHRAKLFSLTEKRPFTSNEILGTAEGVKIFAEWAPKTELFRRNRGHGGVIGVIVGRKEFWSSCKSTANATFCNIS